MSTPQLRPAITSQNGTRAGVLWLVVNPVPPRHGRGVNPRPRRSTSVTIWVVGQTGVFATAPLCYLGQTNPSGNTNIGPDKHPGFNNTVTLFQSSRRECIGTYI